MAFQKRGSSNVVLAGFWNREVGQVLTGKLLKFVPNDSNPKKVRPFYILEAEAPAKGEKATLNVEGKETAVNVKNGDFVGVQANWSLTSQLDKVLDIGNRLRITVDGTKPSPQDDKKMMTLVTVEVDEA